MAGHCGRGIRVLATEDHAASVPLGETDLLVTRFVEQHAYARNIFPDATNTLRMLVLRDEQGPFLATAAHRFGTSTSAPTDNVAGGGIGVGIDMASGTLGRAAHQPRRTNAKLVWLERHPDTGTPMPGVQIPGWHDLVAELLEITARLPFLHHLGWDVVVTDDGFVIIEGNHNSNLSGLQVHGPLLANERVRSFYRRHGVIA